MYILSTVGVVFVGRLVCSVHALYGTKLHWFIEPVD